MTNGIYSGVQAMASTQRQMDSLATNLANISKDGYKRQTSFVYALNVAKNGGTREELRVGTQVDFTQGEVEATENPLDLALDGPGFFAVEGPDGELYTRNGQFQIDESGVLETLDGLTVAWDELRGAIDTQGLPVSVNGDGTVTQEGRDLGRLRIVGFEDQNRLETLGGTYFAAPLDLRESAHEATVVQGALERSNVSPIDEMVAMISVQRRFAGASNLLGLINDTYRRLSRLQ